MRELESNDEGQENSVSVTYRKARTGAAIETGLEIETFPESCPFELYEILDEEFLG